MAKISIKQKRRYRVQISINKGLWERYNRNLELAKQLGAEIDFSKDFEPWFTKQNDQANHDLLQLLNEQQPAAVAVELDGGATHVDN
jgi:hypothetical protein